MLFLSNNVQENKNVQADILANLLYVTVGFSLVEIFSKDLLQVTNLNQLGGVAVNFATLIVPSVVFVTYIKTHEHRFPLLVLDYLFLFFVSSFALSLTPEGQQVTITLWNNWWISLTTLSLEVMIFYPLVLEIYSLRAKGIFRR